ncbi:MAG: F0F1 ATP synthase subunit delta [Candidatus Moraniibacteriota bacterium]
MRPTVSQYAQALEELATHAMPKEVSAIIGNFIGLLKRRGEGQKLDAIVKRLEKIGSEKAGRITVLAVTAHEATNDVKETLVVRAQQLFPRKKIDLRYSVDAGVIGGVRFLTDEVLYDATLGSETQALKHSLLKA